VQNLPQSYAFLLTLQKNISMDVRIDNSWKQALASEWDKPYFANLTAFVRQEYATTTVFPPAARIFAAFDACPFDDVKVVILGQDPYHDVGQANGLCFSVADGVPMPPSLVNILREVSSDTGAAMPESGNLERWAKQGVLLLNSALTVRAHAAASHRGRGWEEFTDSVILKLSQCRKDLVFLLWGSFAISKQRLIDPSRHLVLTSPHPSPLSAYRGFFGNHHFTKANEWLIAHGKQPIVW
jgi:uracil-DNA glycosylase